MSFFKPRMTTRFDVATAFVGAALACFKAWDTRQKYKQEQAVINDMPPSVRKGYNKLKEKK